jgi:hypothetical protein
MLNLNTALKLLEHGIAGEQLELEKLKSLILDEILINNIKSQSGNKEVTRFKAAKKFIDDIIKDQPNRPYCHGCWYSANREYQYICNGYILFRLKNHIPGLKEVEEVNINRNCEKFFDDLDSKNKDYNYIDNDLNLAQLKTTVSELKAKYPKTELGQMPDERIYVKLEKEGIENKYIFIKYIINALELVSSYNQQEYKIYSHTQKTSQIYISNDIDSAMILSVRRAD